MAINRFDEKGFVFFNGGDGKSIAEWETVKLVFELNGKDIDAINRNCHIDFIDRANCCPSLGRIN